MYASRVEAPTPSNSGYDQASAPIEVSMVRMCFSHGLSKHEYCV